MLILELCTMCFMAGGVGNGGDGRRSLAAGGRQGSSQGCARARRAEERHLGFSSSNESSNWSPSCPSLGERFLTSFHMRGLHLGKLAFQSGNVLSSGHMSSVGVPNFMKIWKSVEISESPAQSGRPVAISPKRQPAAHASTSSEQPRAPRSTSGATYHMQYLVSSWRRKGTEKAWAVLKPVRRTVGGSVLASSTFPEDRQPKMTEFEWQ
mmetsp:Transcript_14746/g.37428  ORF Transcript_14746/g.37428 Transcript_14746/m.37428 type:complete len:209 (-) Transcript_14746:444-1070(-)